MSVSPFADLNGLPYYDEPTLHLSLGGRLWAWEFDGWKRGEHVVEDGLLHPRRPVRQPRRSSRGPDVKEFFSSIAVNGFETLQEIGSMKHSIYCNDAGLHVRPTRILQRNDEHEYRYLRKGQPWPHYKLVTSNGRLRRAR